MCVLFICVLPDAPCCKFIRIFFLMVAIELRFGTALRIFAPLFSFFVKIKLQLVEVVMINIGGVAARFCALLITGLLPNYQ